MYNNLRGLNILYLDKDSKNKPEIRTTFSTYFNNFYLSNSPEHTINFFRNDFTSEATIDAIIFNTNNAEQIEIENFISNIRTFNEDIPLILNIEELEKAEILKTIKYNVSGCYNKDLNKDVLLKKLHICVQNHKKHKFIVAQNKELEKIIELFNNVALVSKTNPQGIITYVNDMFCETTGYSKEEVIGKPQNIVRHPHTPKEIFKNMWDTIQKGISWQGSLKNLTKNNTPYFVKATILPILDNENNIIEYASIRFLTTHEEALKRDFRKKVIINIRDFRKKEFLYKKRIKELEDKVESNYVKRLEKLYLDSDDSNKVLRGRILNLEDQIKTSYGQDNKNVNTAVDKYRSTTKELDVLRSKTKNLEVVLSQYKEEVIRKDNDLTKFRKMAEEKDTRIRELTSLLERKEKEITKLSVHNNQLQKKQRR